MSLRHENIDNTAEDATESSEYLDSGSSMSDMDFGGLFSNRFANINLIYRSPAGPAELYSATRYGKRFILKALKAEFRDDPVCNLALSKEFEIGISLDHPNIRRTLSLEAVDDLGKVIVMEYIDGVSLDTFIASGDVTIADARDISRQMADALAYIHARQVFHRDIKPSNIMISHRRNIVKIIDFSLSDSDEFIVLKNPAGSRKYIAPEQLHREAKPSVAADIYSLGVVISELADAAGDNLLAETASICTSANPSKRPASAKAISIPAPGTTFSQTVSNILSSKALTYILACICALLAAAVIYLFITRTI